MLFLGGLPGGAELRQGRGRARAGAGRGSLRLERLADLTGRFPRPGRIDWIGLRPGRLADLRAVEAGEITEAGLAGDHARPGKRAVTLIQAEHLPVVAALVGQGDIAPETLRRNIVISGLNLTAARHHLLRLGGALLRPTVPCAPCSRMERALGPGGYNALRGHGGWCCEVVEPGRVALGDAVQVERA